MKPIEQMSINECLWVICNPMEVSPQYTSTEILKEIADRINDLTRWIPLSERMPDEDDGEVLLMYDGGFIQYAPWGFADKEAHTHWRRIDKPEGV